MGLCWNIPEYHMKGCMTPTWMWSAGYPGSWGCQKCIGEVLRVWKGAIVRSTPERNVWGICKRSLWKEESALCCHFQRAPIPHYKWVIRKSLPCTSTSPHPSLSANSQGATHFSCQVVEDAKREEAKLPSLFHRAGFGLKWGENYSSLWVERTLDKNLEGFF